MKAITLDLPYPEIKDMENDYRSAAIISPAYAGLHSELTAILQYIFHSFYFAKLNMPEYADTMEGIALAEMRHFDILGTLILALGVNPVYTLRPPRKEFWFNTSTVAYSTTPERMLLDDIAGELAAINGYENMLEELENEQVGAVIQRIKLDEELHVRVLKELYTKLLQSHGDKHLTFGEEKHEHEESMENIPVPPMPDPRVGH